VIARSIRSEVLKLRRRSLVLGGGGAMAALAAVGAAIAVVAGGGSRPGPGSGPAVSADADGLAAAIASPAQLVGAVALCIAAWSVATEYSAGTLRNLLVRMPQRAALLSGKLLAIGAAVAVGTSIAAVVAGAAALVTAAVHGTSTDAWLSSAGVAAAAEAALRLAAVSVGWALIGATLAVTLRSPTLAIGIGLAYALPFEQLLAAAWSTAAAWLPGQLLTAIAEGGSAATGAVRAAVIFAAYALAALVGAIALFRRRDVA